MQNVSSLSKEELHLLHKNLTIYQKLQKAIGKRGVAEYHRLKNGKNILKVEYFPTTDFSWMQSQALEIYQKIYNQKIDASVVNWIEKKEIQWWMRVFFNDAMVDMSFARFSHMFQ